MLAFTSLYTQMAPKYRSRGRSCIAHSDIDDIWFPDGKKNSIHWRGRYFQVIIGVIFSSKKLENWLPRVKVYGFCNTLQIHVGYVHNILNYCWYVSTQMGWNSIMQEMGLWIHNTANWRDNVHVGQNTVAVSGLQLTLMLQVHVDVHIFPNWCNSAFLWVYQRGFTLLFIFTVTL